MTGWIERPSPNHGMRAAGEPIDILLLHYTGMADAEGALARLTDPAAEVSCHWLIDTDGALYRLVDEARRAWHAGASFWAGARDINSRSIGIELVNPGHELGYPPFPPAQMAALAELAQGILARHPIPAHRVLAHSDVAPTRKIDPGEKLDWAWLAERGIGIWPAPEAGPESTDPAADLARIGYEDAEPATLAAFQRHFRPALVDGRLDGETRCRIAQLAAAIEATDRRMA
jgi:N-acetylmuramoyl-L-alanine amidase